MENVSFHRITFTFSTFGQPTQKRNDIEGQVVVSRVCKLDQLVKGSKTCLRAFIIIYSKEALDDFSILLASDVSLMYICL